MHPGPRLHASPDPDGFDPTTSPVYWFVKLETAVEKGDFEAAAEAQRELRRLGVDDRTTAAYYRHDLAGVRSGCAELLATLRRLQGDHL
jgi:hypothetical protein